MRSFANSFASVLPVVLSVLAPGQNASWGIRSNYSDATVLDSSVRSARSAFFNGFSGESPLSDSSRRALLNYGPSNDPNDPLPVDVSSAVVTAKVTAGKSFLSTDKTTIYTEVRARLASVMLDRSGQGLTQGGSIVVLRPGGVVMMPSGMTIIRGSLLASIPRATGPYLMFLQWTPHGNFFRLVTGFEVDGQDLYSLDAVLNAGSVASPAAPQYTLSQSDFSLEQVEAVVQAAASAGH